MGIVWRQWLAERMPKIETSHFLVTLAARMELITNAAYG